MKKVFIDFHVIQTVPPSCINRDDTGSPKTAVYGGVTRARVSSQSWKHAMRKMFVERFDEADLGIRTKRIVDLVAERILEQDPQKSEEEARDLAKGLAEKIATVAGIKMKDEETKALFFMSTKQAENLAKLVLEDKTLSKKDKDIKKDIQNALNKDHGVEIALFGRMVADDPTLNVDASAQIAHSISTHRVDNEYDYFTAVDDRAPEDNVGAGMIGTIEFNSSTLYRYATVAVHELFLQLSRDPETLAKVIAEFARAFVTSMPTGRQNTFANRTLPSAVMVSLRTDQPLNLVDAFEKPVRGEGMAVASAKRFTNHAERVYADFSVSPEVSWVIGEELSSLGQKVDFDTLLTSLEEEIRARFVFEE